MKLQDLDKNRSKENSKEQEILQESNKEEPIEAEKTSNLDILKLDTRKKDDFH